MPWSWSCPERSAARRRLCEAYGARIVETDAIEGSDGALVRVRSMVAEHPARYFYADQYRNPANPLAHYRTTGPEIWEQTGGRVTHFVAGLGTTGTVVGVSRFLRERSRGVRVVAVEPDHGLHGLEGLKHMATSIVPEVYDPTAHDERIVARTGDAPTSSARTRWPRTGCSSGTRRAPRYGRRARWRARCGTAWWWPCCPTAGSGTCPREPGSGVGAGHQMEAMLAARPRRPSLEVSGVLLGSRDGRGRGGGGRRRGEPGADRAPETVRDRARRPVAPAAGGPGRGPGDNGLLSLAPRSPGASLGDRPPDGRRGPVRRRRPRRRRRRCEWSRRPLGLGVSRCAPGLRGGAPGGGAPRGGRGRRRRE